MADPRVAYEDAAELLAVLRNIEKAGPGTGMTLEDARETKLAILEAEAGEMLVSRRLDPLGVLALLRRVNAETQPVLEDRHLAEALYCAVKKRFVDFGRAGEIPVSAQGLFKAAEAQVRAQAGTEPARLHVPVVDDALQSGLYPGTIVGIVGHEGALKSSLALHLAEKNVWSNPSIRCLFANLDMTGEMLAFRRASRWLDVHEAEVRKMAESGAPEYLKARDGIAARDGERLFFASGPLSIEGLRKQVMLTVANLVVVDYIGLLATPDEPDVFRALRKNLDGIKRLRDETGAAFCLLSQMSRASKLAARGGQAGGHAFGGAAFEQLLDVELELVLDEPLEPEEEQKRLVCTITKNRFGPEKLPFELEYVGKSKRITGRAWRLRKETQKKPAFGSRIQF